MRNSQSRPILITILPVLTIATIIFLVSCSKREKEIDLMDGLPPELAELLVRSSYSELSAYAHEVGLETLIDAKRHFDDVIQDMSSEQYLCYSDSLYTLQKRVNTILAKEFNHDFYLNDLEYLRDFPPAERQRHMIMRAAIWQTSANNNLSPDARIDSILGYYDVMVEHNDRLGMGIAKLALTGQYGAIGDKEKEKQTVIEAHKEFSEVGMHRLTCQSLGYIGSIYLDEGKVDSMEMCYETARELAIRVKLSDQISRFSYFYAMQYARMGRLALANDLINEAIELCKENKGGSYEIRFIFHAMEFYAEYSCWETVERLLSRARILEKVYDDAKYSANYASGGRFIEARLNMARGNVEKANALFRETDELNQKGPYLVNPFNLLFYWGKGLLDNDLPDEATEIVDRGLNSTRQRSSLRYEGKFLALKAAAEFERGNIDGARQAIRRFDAIAPKVTEPLYREEIRMAILCARIAFSESDTAGALEFVEESLTKLKSYLKRMDISVQGYLWTNDYRELRTLLHELTARDPKLGYGAELLWRSLPLYLGSDRVGSGSSSEAPTEATARGGTAEREYSDLNLIELCDTLADEAMTNLRNIDAVHFIYAVEDNEILRFVADREIVEKAAIPWNTEEMHNFIIETNAAMSGDVQTEAMADTVDVLGNLAQLGRQLLPSGLREYARSSAPRTLLISTDDFLNLVPFETLDTGDEEDYTPLLEEFDIAYLRHANPGSGRNMSDGQGIIIVNSDFAKSTRSRIPFGSRLRHVQSEGLAVASLDRDAVILEGPNATKREIKERWENASYLYFATHIIRDPEIPYLVLIPVATPEGDSSPESNYLDFSDIRSADFSKCGLVVLSGCSSGVPSVATRIIGPSLGDAFLDAGAAVVITTFWDVKDEDARMLMTAYTDELNSSGSSHIKALCDARRRLFTEARDSGESFSWASYAIHSGGFNR